VHGVALEWGNFHGTFLPQAWEEMRDPAVFLAQLKRKAGLSESFWSPEMKLRVYTVAKRKEPELEQ
jgi:AMMECR1 domain-containing protein